MRTARIHHSQAPGLRIPYLPQSVHASVSDVLMSQCPGRHLVLFTLQSDLTPCNALPRPLTNCEVLFTTAGDTQAQRPLTSGATDKSGLQTLRVQHRTQSGQRQDHQSLPQWEYVELTSEDRAKLTPMDLSSPLLTTIR